jgi:hypothetical protein
MSNDPLRDIARLAHQVSKYSGDASALAGPHGSPEKLAKRVIRRQIMRNTYFSVHSVTLGRR